MKITKEWLEKHGACGYQITVFETEWPDGVTVTKEVLIRAAKLNLDLE